MPATARRLPRLLATALTLAATAADAQTPAPAAPPAREGWAVADDGVRLHYRVHGAAGDTLIYVHGGPGGNAGRQIPNLLALAERHVLVAYDQRAGNGRSDAGDTLALGPARHVADLDAVRRAVGAERVALFGHSWGAALALLYADAHPAHVTRLILNGPMPPARTPFDAERDRAVAARVAERCAAAGTSEAERAACRERPEMQARIYFADTLNMRRDRGVAVPGGARAAGGAASTVGNRVTLRALGDWDHRPAMRHVRVPALVIEGAQSPVPLEQMRIWARTLPDARLLLVEGAGHGYAYIERPDVFFPAVEAFLGGRWPDGAVRPESTPDDRATAPKRRGGG